MAPQTVLHPLEVDVHLLKGGILGLVPVLLDGHGVETGELLTELTMKGIAYANYSNVCALCNFQQTREEV